VKILISAAEASSDAHGAALLKALKEKAGLEIDAFGIGGPHLQKAGLRTVVDARELLAMGFFEILGRLPRIIKALNQIHKTAVSEKPDVAVVIDYPDFHFRFAKRLKSSGIPLVYFIPPKVWVWRKSRLNLLRELFTKVLCIFPFEEKIYQQANINASYVGNPLIDELPLNLTKQEARKKLSLANDDKVLLLMPGSRPSEFYRHVKLMMDASVGVAEKMRQKGYIGSHQKLMVLMTFPTTSMIKPKWKRAAELINQINDCIELRLSLGDSHLALVAADAALVKSGTSTLEAALLKCPLAVVYKPSNFAGWVWRNFIKYKGPVGLVNLIDSKNQYVAKEILCRDVKPQALIDEAFFLLTDDDRRRAMLEAFDRIRDKIFEKGSPSQKAAEEIIALVNTRGKLR